MDAARQTSRSRCAPMRRTASIASATNCSFSPTRCCGIGTRRSVPGAELLATVDGRTTFDGLAVRHPFLDRDSVIVLADYVDLETGTGAVHTAPGHGADDFDTGVKYGLPILNPGRCARTFHERSGTVRRSVHLQGQQADHRRPGGERASVCARTSTNIRIRTAGAATIR